MDKNRDTEKNKLRTWVQVNTSSGLSHLNVNNIIAISDGYDKYGDRCCDLHLVSGTIFTIKGQDLDKITKHIQGWR